MGQLKLSGEDIEVEGVGVEGSLERGMRMVVGDAERAAR